MSVLQPVVRARAGVFLWRHVLQLRLGIGRRGSTGGLDAELNFAVETRFQ